MFYSTDTNHETTDMNPESLSSYSLSALQTHCGCIRPHRSILFCSTYTSIHPRL